MQQLQATPPLFTNYNQSKLAFRSTVYRYLNLRTGTRAFSSGTKFPVSQNSNVGFSKFFIAYWYPNFSIGIQYKIYSFNIFDFSGSIVALGLHWKHMNMYKPNLENLKVWDCLAYMRLHILKNKIATCVILWYALNKTTYRFWILRLMWVLNQYMLFFMKKFFF